MLGQIAIILFSYLIWVQSTRYDKKETEGIIRERMDGNTFTSSDKRVAIEIFDCILIEKSDLSIQGLIYNLKRTFVPYGSSEGKIVFYLVPHEEMNDWKLPEKSQIDTEDYSESLGLRTYKVTEVDTVRIEMTLQNIDDFSENFEEFVNSLTESFAETEDIGPWKRQI